VYLINKLFFAFQTYIMLTEDRFNYCFMYCRFEQIGMHCFTSYKFVYIWQRVPLGRSRRRWEDNIKMDLQEVGGGRGDWMELAEDRDRRQALMGMVRDFWVP